MLTIQNIDKIINITSPLPYKWHISAVGEFPDDLYGFEVLIGDVTSHMGHPLGKEIMGDNHSIGVVVLRS